MIVQLPTPQDLAPWIEKPEGHPGSVVLIAVEQPETCNFAACTAAWLSREERKVLRRALEAMPEETRTGSASQNLSLRCDDTRTETEGLQRDPRAKER